MKYLVSLLTMLAPAASVAIGDGTTPPTAAPEPSTLALFGAAATAAVVISLLNKKK